MISISSILFNGDKVKVNFICANPESHSIDGFLFLSQEEFYQTNFSELPKLVADKAIEKLSISKGV